MLRVIITIALDKGKEESSFSKICTIDKHDVQTVACLSEDFDQLIKKYNMNYIRGEEKSIIIYNNG